MSGGQLYIGASAGNSTTADSHRLTSGIGGSGIFKIQSNEGGTWTDHFAISTSGVITGNFSATDSTKLPLAGGTMTGDIVLGSNSVTGTGNSSVDVTDVYSFIPLYVYRCKVELMIICNFLRMTQNNLESHILQVIADLGVMVRVKLQGT